jgi:NadR type nicotinamide-nucleotide adenylyltransferase
MAALESLPHRVVLTGSESTGKTTLAVELAGHFRVEWVPEYVREYLDLKHIPLDAEDVEPIARGQIAAQDAALARARSLLVLDTDLLSTMVYATHYYGACPEWIGSAAAARRGDLYLLCDIDIPWTADPQRDRSHDRVAMQTLFRDALLEHGLPFEVIGGGREERLEVARRAIERMLMIDR